MSGTARGETREEAARSAGTQPPHAGETSARRPGSRADRLGPGFTKLWLASSVSAVGDGMALTAAPLLATRLTTDPRSIAAVTAALTVPYALFGIPAGVIADRVELRGAMARIDWVRAALLAALTLCVAFGFGRLFLLYVCFFLVGLGETFFRNASQILVPHVVVPSGLVAANSRQQAAQVTGNQFLGPLAGASLFALAAAAPFGVDAATFLVSAVLLTTLRVSAAPARSAGLGAAPRPPLRREVFAGLAWLWRHRLLRALSAASALINFVTTGALAVLVVEAHAALRLGDAGYGVLLAGQAFGAVLAAKVSPGLTRRIGGEWSLVLAVLAIAAGYAGIWLLRSALVAGLALALAACADVTWNVVVVHLRQTLIPPRLQGRVNSVYRLVAWGAMPVGAAAAGFLAAATGAPSVFGAGALILAAVAVPLALGARARWFAGAVVS
ncbi:MFS transporter [Actinocrinis puniceicyclus]|uniref:MFS transporter n=1 Tax=Actinocrinis puniceicyclus TaxID=977794 RepID=A0A8J7WMK0_9ACTN|nr:MFS transporter [Actinocrinis puniceicyclus]MBS2965143.1 MFS transporter [Actinocrinis puniceicyclus]